jgi:hypothetical protein
MTTCFECGIGGQKEKCGPIQNFGGETSWEIVYLEDHEKDDNTINLE